MHTQMHGLTSQARYRLHLKETGFPRTFQFKIKVNSQFADNVMGVALVILLTDYLPHKRTKVSIHMPIFNCENCNQAYQRALASKTINFCDDCRVAYEQAFIKIHEYLLENQRPDGYQLKDVELLAAEAGVSRSFVKRFFKDGEYQKSILEKGQSACQRCHTILRADERKYCRACSQQLTGTIQTISDNIMGKTQANPKRRSSLRRGQDDDRSYGFKRDFAD